VLNGTSSAGKTTLASGLQARFAEAGECWFVIGLDDMFAMLPESWVTYRDHIGPHADEGIAFVLVDGAVERRVGPVARSVLAAYRGWVSASARAGLDVIVDEVLLDEADWRGWLDELDGLDVTWVRVDCDLAIVEARERARGDRMVGVARGQVEVVHRYPTYAVRVDTGASGPDEAADVVFAAISSTDTIT